MWLNAYAVRNDTQECALLGGEMTWMYTLYGHPASKKNSKRIVTPKKGKRPLLISSERYMDWAKQAKRDINSSEKPEKPITDSCRVTIVFVMADERRRDLTNMAEGVMDCLVECGVLSDDNWKVCREVHLKAVRLPEKGSAKVWIIIDE